MAPREAAYRDWLGILLAEQGRFDDALQQLSLARLEAPAWPNVYSVQALVATYARQNDLAISSARRYVDLLPNLSASHNTLAWVYFEAGRYREAASEWRQMALLQNDPAYTELLARDKLDLMKPGETIFRMEPGSEGGH